jgi:hypothetical protein
MACESLAFDMVGFDTVGFDTVALRAFGGPLRYRGSAAPMVCAMFTHPCDSGIFAVS